MTARFVIIFSGNGVKKVKNFQVEMERCFYGEGSTRGFFVLHKFFHGLEAFRQSFEIRVPVDSAIRA